MLAVGVLSFPSIISLPSSSSLNAKEGFHSLLHSRSYYSLPLGSNVSNVRKSLNLFERTHIWYWNGKLAMLCGNKTHLKATVQYMPNIKMILISLHAQVQYSTVQY